MTDTDKGAAIIRKWFREWTGKAATLAPNEVRDTIDAIRQRGTAFLDDPQRDLAARLSTGLGIKFPTGLES